MKRCVEDRENMEEVVTTTQTSSALAEQGQPLKKGIYFRFGKRFLDIVCSLAVIALLWWLYLLVALLVRIKLGK